MEHFYAKKQKNGILLLKWKPKCNDYANIINYNITYCPVHECANKIQTVPILNKNESSYVLKNLAAFTNYSITIKTIHKETFDQTIYETTLEDVPSPARNLNYSNLTNTSVILNWMPPEYLNGQNIYYKVCCTEPLSMGFCPNPTNTTKMNQKIIDLESSKEYLIYVIACNSCGCSQSSRNISVTTKIGSPDSIESVYEDNFVITWDETDFIGGLHRLYELRMGNKTYLLDGNNCSLTPNYVCGSYQIRIVNFEMTSNISKQQSTDSICKEKVFILPKNTIAGAWSKEYALCKMSNTLISIIIGCSIVVLVFCFILYYLRKKHSKQKDIKCIMPDGLLLGYEDIDNDSILSIKKKNLIKTNAKYYADYEHAVTQEADQVIEIMILIFSINHKYYYTFTVILHHL